MVTRESWRAVGCMSLWRTTRRVGAAAGLALGGTKMLRFAFFETTLVTGHRPLSHARISSHALPVTYDTK